MIKGNSGEHSIQMSPFIKFSIKSHSICGNQKNIIVRKLDNVKKLIKSRSGEENGREQIKSMMSL